MTFISIRMATTWTKNAKESFVDAIGGTTPKNATNTDNGNKNSSQLSNDVANFGNDVYIGKDTNELILMSSIKDLTSNNTVPPEKTTPPSLNDKISDLKTNFNLNFVKY